MKPYTISQYTILWPRRDELQRRRVDSPSASNVGRFRLHCMFPNMATSAAALSAAAGNSFLPSARKSEELIANEMVKYDTLSIFCERNNNEDSPQCIEGLVGSGSTEHGRDRLRTSWLGSDFRLERQLRHERQFQVRRIVGFFRLVGQFRLRFVGQLRFLRHFRYEQVIAVIESPSRLVPPTALMNTAAAGRAADYLRARASRRNFLGSSPDKLHGRLRRAAHNAR